MRAGDQAPREPTLGPLRHSTVVRLCPGDPAPTTAGAPCGKEWWARQGEEPPKNPGWTEPRTTARSQCSISHPGHHAEQGTWGSRARKHRKAGCGRPEDGGVWTAKSVKRPPQQPAQPQYTYYWAPLTCKWHILPHPAQPQHTNHWAPRMWRRHQQEHRPQQPTESSNATQDAKGRTGDCPRPPKETTTKRNVTQGAWAVHLLSSRRSSSMGVQMGRAPPSASTQCHSPERGHPNATKGASCGDFSSAAHSIAPTLCCQRVGY